MRFAAVLVLFLLAACADNWAPVVDEAHDPNAAALPNDLIVCKQLAHAAADQGGTGDGSGVPSEGEMSGFGMMTGAAAGDAARGLEAGAAAGMATNMATGRTHSSHKYNYRHAYISCMQQRGHPVVE